MSRTRKFLTWLKDLGLEFLERAAWPMKRTLAIQLGCSRGEHQPIFGAGSATNLETGKVTKWADDHWSCLYCGKKLSKI